MRTIGIKTKLKLNDIVSCILVLWILNPMSHDYISPIYVGMIAAIWYVTASSESRRVMSRALSSKAFLASLVYPLFMVAYVLAGHARFEKSSLGVPLIVAFYMYTYYRNSIRTDRLVIYGSILFIVLMSFYTIVQLKYNPYISRLLARGNTQSTAGLASPLTAGYNEIYYLVFFAITLIGVLQIYKKRSFQKSHLFLLVLLLFLFIKAQYTIAVLLIIMGTVLIYFRKRTVWKLAGGALLVMGGFLLFVAPDIVANGIYAVSHMIPHGIMKNRVIQIGDLISRNAPVIQGSNGAIVRFNLYQESWNTFLESFFFGVGDDESVFVLNLVGGHSTFIDRLAQYGIFGGGLYIFTRIYILREIRKTLPKEWRYLYTVNILVYIIMSVLNTTNRNSFLMMLMVVIPIFLKYLGNSTGIKHKIKVSETITA
jgi:O-antigen ligase